MGPQKSESPGGTGLVAENKGIGSGQIVGDAAPIDKRVANAIASLALRAHVVHRLADGGYLVVWRGLCRECRDLDELEAHARRVGAMR